MEIQQTSLEGCYIINPKVHKDNRGLFYETYNKRIFNHLIGEEANFVQDNESISSKGVLRGLHFQKGKHAQAKLVRVVKGSVQDVAVDLRPGSKTYGKYISVVLTAKDKNQLFIPRGFAHGFLVLEENTIFNYKCDNFYDKNSESGIRYDDIDLNIDWKLPMDELVLSDKDKELSGFREITS